jgi:Mg-chelatase subunit ChlD
MTRENSTEIVIIIDNSGSMAPLASSTVEGYNSFVAEQKLVPGEARLTTILFNSTSGNLLLHNRKDIQAAKLIKGILPNGTTPLHDAIGHAIDNTGNILSSLEEEDRPGRVIFVIITDGEENSSTEYKGKQINEMINHQREKYSWEFVFMGANQDAIAAGVTLGVDDSRSFNVVASAAGTKSMYQSIGSSMRNYRLTGNFTPEDDDES